MSATMTPTDWLLAGLIALMLLCALTLILGKCADKLLGDLDDAPVCRTADWPRIKRETAALQAAVPAAPAAPRPRHRAGQCAVYSYPPPNLAQVRASAINAALRDLGKHTTTPNPHQPGTKAHSTWAESYARMFSIDKSLQTGVDVALQSKPASANAAPVQPLAPH